MGNGETYALLHLDTITANKTTLDGPVNQDTTTTYSNQSQHELHSGIPKKGLQ